MINFIQPHGKHSKPTFLFTLTPRSRCVTSTENIRFITSSRDIKRREKTWNCDVMKYMHNSDVALRSRRVTLLDARWEGTQWFERARRERFQVLLGVHFANQEKLIAPAIYSVRKMLMNCMQTKSSGIRTGSGYKIGRQDTETRKFNFSCTVCRLNQIRVAFDISGRLYLCPKF